MLFAVDLARIWYFLVTHHRDAHTRRSRKRMEDHHMRDLGTRVARLHWAVTCPGLKPTGRDWMGEGEG